MPGIDDTSTVGILGASVGLSAQWTKAKTVDSLYGTATYIGASGGPSWYVGGDIVSFDDASDNEMSTDGFQLTGGVGVGIDVHVTESYTRPVPSLKKQTNRTVSTNNRFNLFSLIALLFK